MSEFSQEKRDKKYNDWARRNPAIVSIVFPLLVAVYFFQENTAELNTVRYLVGVVLSFGTIIPALFFFYQSSIREISILLVECPLFGILGRPSVNYMMKKNSTLTDDRKMRIIDKAKKSNISLLIIEENIKEEEKQKRIVLEAFESIREICRENPILFEFNCTYGFFRNLSGGLLVDLGICIILSIFNYIRQLGIGDMLLYSTIVIIVLLVFCYFCTYFSAKRFAKRVYVLYDSDKIQSPSNQGT